MSTIQIVEARKLALWIDDNYDKAVTARGGRANTN